MSNGAGKFRLVYATRQDFFNKAPIPAKLSLYSLPDNSSPPLPNPDYSTHQPKLLTMYTIIYWLAFILLLVALLHRVTLRLVDSLRRDRQQANPTTLTEQRRNQSW